MEDSTKIFIWQEKRRSMLCAYGDVCQNEQDYTLVIFFFQEGAQHWTILDDSQPPNNSQRFQGYAAGGWGENKGC